MILPHPESNLKLNLLVLGAEVILIMKNSFRNKPVFVDNVMNEFLKKDKNRTVDLFFDSITFLYTVGCIEKSGHKIKLTRNNKRFPKQLTFFN